MPRIRAELEVTIRENAKPMASGISDLFGGYLKAVEIK